MFRMKREGLWSTVKVEHQLRKEKEVHLLTSFWDKALFWHPND
jgi:hypothetical protein